MLCICRPLVAHNRSRLEGSIRCQVYATSRACRTWYPRRSVFNDPMVYTGRTHTVLVPQDFMTEFLWNSLTHPRAQFKCPGSDRKSTRLNSSHVEISYAVFCLHKKLCVLRDL